MKCKKCGNEFVEGIFCPECGTKYSIEDKNKVVCKSTEDILSNKLEKVITEIIVSEMTEDEENKMIARLGWPNTDNVFERIHKRCEIYYKVRSMRVQTTSAQQRVAEMKQDIEHDYNELKKKDGNLGAQIFWACVCTWLSITFLFPRGIIGIIIGAWVTWAFWSAVSDIMKARKCLDELAGFMKNL